MKYRIECKQTIFGKEREHRLRLAFDIIWNLDLQKIKAEKLCCGSQNPCSPTVIVPPDEVEGKSNEMEKDLPSEAEKED